MLENFKDLIGKQFQDWTHDIRETPEKMKIHDISKAFIEIMAKNMLAILLGEDINEERFDLMMRVDGKGSKFHLKNVKLHEALEECWYLIIATVPKVLNPFCMLGFISYSTDVTPF